MEWLALIAIYVVLKLLFSGGGSADPSIGALELRFTDAQLGEDNDGPPFKAIEAKGLIPLTKTRRVGFVTSVLDNTDDETVPVICALDTYQEPETTAFQDETEIGEVSLGGGFPEWVCISGIIPELLKPPYGGRRKFIAVVRLVDLDDKPKITLGCHEPDDPRILWMSTLVFEHTFAEKGYAEAAKHRDEARGLSVQIGMAVAMADGSLDDKEGEILKEWITKMISPFSDDKREELKNLYNKSMTRAYESAKSGDLSFSDLTEKLNEIAEKSTKYETVELCFDVMAADGVLHAEEMRVIRKVAEALDLDLDEIEKMQDQKIIGIKSYEGTLEEALGIEPDWGTERIKKHLTAVFQRWNNRLNTLPEGEERDNAQRMLDLISEARTKYG